MIIMRTLKTALVGLGLIAFAWTGLASNAGAQSSAENAATGQIGGEITLRSSDGFTQLRGTLLEFDGGVYTIQTVIGVIQVSAMQVSCEGDACPQDVMFGVEFGIFGSNTVGAELMPALVEGYADTLDASVVIEVGQNALERTVRIIHDDGREMAAIDLRSRGSTTSFVALGASEAEIGMSSRRMRDRDLPLLREGGIGELRDTIRK